MTPATPYGALVVRALWVATLTLATCGCSGRAAEAPVALQAPLQELARSGQNPRLHWPGFADFSAEVQRLYARAAWQPLWLSGAKPTPAAERLIERLAAADSLGLEPADYDADWLGSEAQRLSVSGTAPASEELAQFDIGLSVAAVRFVSALHRGRVSPRLMHAALFIPRSFLAVEMVVDSLRDAEAQGSVLERVQPRMLHYQLLKNALARFRELATDSTLLPLPAIPRGTKPGMRLAAAPQLRKLLTATGDITAPVAPGRAGGGVYSADLVAGIRQFQRRQGFEPDGVIGPATAERLSRPFAQRVRQIELVLERFRWLPPTFAAPPIIVNIPAYRLYAFKGASDREADMLMMDVVVGDSFDKHTPVFAADMKYLIFRPYWEVPTSIMLAEVGPKAMRDPAFLKHEGMVLMSGEGADATELPQTRANVALIGKGVRVRQRPGPMNALGRVKFILPNANDVYLHDTPAQGAFARARRDKSHGCIRLSDPAALAAHVLRDQPDWTPERIAAAMEGEDNQRVNLSRPIPVCIVYSTAITRENGDTYFYLDTYGLDLELDQLLVKGYPYPK